MGPPGVLELAGRGPAEGLDERGRGAAGGQRLGGQAHDRRRADVALEQVEDGGPQQGGVARAGGKAGREPSRSRRAMAGRAKASWPDSQGPAPSHSQAQRLARATDARRKGGGH